MPELPQEIEEKIRQYYGLGYEHYDHYRFKEALRNFYRAWILVPKPQTRYEMAGWILTALGDCYFRMRNYQSGREALRSAIHCPNSLRNPFVHLRLGQCFYELNQRQHAYREFKLAIELGGLDIFAHETVKYINFYRKQEAFKIEEKA